MTLKIKETILHKVRNLVHSKIFTKISVAHWSPMRSLTLGTACHRRTSVIGSFHTKTLLTESQNFTRSQFEWPRFGTLDRTMCRGATSENTESTREVTVWDPLCCPFFTWRNLVQLGDKCSLFLDLIRKFVNWHLGSRDIGQDWVTLHHHHHRLWNHSSRNHLSH